MDVRLYFNSDLGNNKWDTITDNRLLATLQNLPNLEEFHLDQDFPGRFDAIS